MGVDLTGADNTGTLTFFVNGKELSPREEPAGTPAFSDLPCNDSSQLWFAVTLQRDKDRITIVDGEFPDSDAAVPLYTHKFATLWPKDKVEQDSGPQPPQGTPPTTTLQSTVGKAKGLFTKMFRK